MEGFTRRHFKVLYKKKMKNILTITLILLLSFTSFCQKKSNIELPAISINSLFLKAKIKKGIPFYYYNYDNTILRNSKYRVLRRTKINVNKNKKDLKSEGLDIVRLKSDLTIGQFTNFISIGYFKKGYKNGLWKTTYKSKLVKSINYNNGLVVGKYRVYNIKKELLYKTTFGIKGNGNYKDYYHKTGILKQEGYYENGKKSGEWCDYFNDGTLSKTIIYSGGMPIKH